MTALFVAGSTKLFKALVNGDGVGRDEAAELASSLFEVLLQVREQGEALARIEAKVDRSLQQDFDRSYRMGAYLLRDAAHARLDSAAQDEAIRSARTRFLEAAAGTSNGGQHVQALHAAAGCSLLTRRPDTARAELDDAWVEAFNVLKEAARRWINTVTGTVPKLSEELRFGSANKRNLRIQADLEAEVAPLRPVVKDIQMMRQALGAPESECAVPVFVRNTHPYGIPELPWWFRPFFIRARGGLVILPDGSSVKLRAKIDQPQQLSLWPSAAGAWVRAEAEVNWAKDEEPVAAIHPIVLTDNDVWSYTYTTLTGVPQPNQYLKLVNSWDWKDYQKHELHYEAGCGRVDMIGVSFFSAWANPWVCIGFDADACGGTEL